MNCRPDSLPDLVHGLVRASGVRFGLVRRSGAQVAMNLVQYSKAQEEKGGRGGRRQSISRINDPPGESHSFSPSRQRCPHWSRVVACT